MPVNSGFHTHKNFSETYPQFGAHALKIFASPVPGKKKEGNIGFKGRQFINMPRMPTSQAVK